MLGNVISIIFALDGVILYTSYNGKVNVVDCEIVSETPKIYLDDKIILFVNV